MAKHTMQELYSMQAAPLSVKVLMTAERIRNWVNEFGEDYVTVIFTVKIFCISSRTIYAVCNFFSKKRETVLFANFCERNLWFQNYKIVKSLGSKNNSNIILTDRQTDRQTDRRFRMLAIWQTC